MSDQNQAGAPTETLEVDLKIPALAALLAWLWPGAGHLYQGRTAKGVLYMICILSTYFYGFWMGQGHVVYASWTPQDRRLPYICQIGVGLPALPALIQNRVTTRGQASPLGTDMMAPPYVNPHWQVGDTPDQLSQWHEEAGVGFELGTLFTMVAGLLNILAIYDAFAGPVFSKPEEKNDDKQRGPPDDERQDKPKDT